MTAFPPARSTVMVLLLWVLVLALPVPIFLALTEGKGWEILFPVIILCAVEALLLWLLFDTGYVVDGDKLMYRSGPVRGTIDINKITRIQHDNSWMKPTTLKPALDGDGLLIRYSRYDDIFIAPKDKEAFVSLLCQINPNITVA